MLASFVKLTKYQKDRLAKAYQKKKTLFKNRNYQMKKW